MVECQAKDNFIKSKGILTMKRISTLNTRSLGESVVDGGCGECQTSCQSACKTSCGVANQRCESRTGPDKDAAHARL